MQKNIKKLVLNIKILFMKTTTQTPKDIQKSWKLVNASKQSLGRLASSVAQILMGKNKVNFSPHLMCGDFVIIINSNKVKLTGKKWTQKQYYTRSRFIGSLKSTQACQLPTTTLIKKAIEGMLPKNSHRPRALKRLKIFTDSQHTYQDKNPQEVLV